MAESGRRWLPFSRFLTLLEESVMRILCCTSCVPWKPSLPAFIGGAYASSVAMAAGGGAGEEGLELGRREGEGAAALGAGRWEGK
jgi:hypothetical protein